MSDPQKTSGHFLMNPYVLVVYLIVTFVVLTNTNLGTGWETSIPFHTHTKTKIKQNESFVFFSA